MKNSVLAAAIKKLRMSYKDLARASGIPDISWYNYEGMRDYPRIKRQRQIYEFFKKNGIELQIEEVFPESIKPMARTEGFSCFGTIWDLEETDLDSTSSIVEFDEFMTELRRILARLTKKEEDIVRAYYGIFGEKRRNYEEIGRELGLTKQRVEQIFKKALGKLRRKETRRRLENSIPYIFYEY